MLIYRKAAGIMTDNRETTEIFSERYGVKGRVRECGETARLCFEYGGKRHEIGLSRALPDDFSKYWLEIMEQVIGYLSAPEKAPRLYGWTIRFRRANGTVVGHPEIADSTYVYTSELRGIETDDELGAAVIITDNRVYRADLKDCAFGLQEEYAAELTQYDELWRSIIRAARNGNENADKNGGVL